MPELPEVETTKKSLAPLLNTKVQAVELHQPKLRWQIPSDIDALIGYTLTNVERCAKYLILHFTKGSKDKRSVIVHLGMSGSLQQYPQGADKRKHDHLILHFIDDKLTDDDPIDENHITQLHYHDPRRFGAILWADEADDTGKTYRQRLLEHLGPEPLADTFDTDYLYRYIQRLDVQGNKISKHAKPISRAIKSVIMEQKVVVGVGNIYATESLFLANIHPTMPANKLTKSQLAVLVTQIKSVIAKAIEKGGSTLNDFSYGEGATGYFQQTLLVYGQAKQPCPHCSTIIETVQINGRASAYCSNCQPLK